LKKDCRDDTLCFLNSVITGNQKRKLDVRLPDNQRWKSVCSSDAFLMNLYDIMMELSLPIAEMKDDKWT